MRHNTTILTVLVGLCTGLVGCPHGAGTLRVELAVPQTIRPDQSMPVEVTFVADGGPVVLAKNGWVDVSIKGMGRTCRNKYAFCGNEAMGAFITAPIYFPILWLDVADTLGRFQTLESGTKAETWFVFQPTTSGYTSFKHVADAESARQVKFTRDPANWPLGEYRVCARVNNINRGVSGWTYPAPIFWQVTSPPEVCQTVTCVRLDEEPKVSAH
jgi:hypothetical protein